ncbi:vacuolar protein sorting-associated protein 11 homolog [Drosophila tropicalis]|uniref:vacuolar protein sorting-associated protein 11 homolog n=1 Tax=Drosophila tropicalis TaxID=46794 RepID=UPI0035ABD04B
MSVLEWKKLDLFHLVIPPPNTNLQSLSGEITAHCFNWNTTVFCEQNGFIHVYMENWENVVFKSQLGDKQPIKFCALTNNGLLATATQDDNFVVSIHIYDLKRLSRKQGAPIISTANLPSTSIITCMQVETLSEKIFALSIGFDKGDILLHYGKLIKDLTTSIRQFSIGLRPINGIQFENSSTTDAVQPTCNIFVISLDGVFCFSLNDKGPPEPKLKLQNDKKSFNRCCTIRQQKGVSMKYPEPEALLVVGSDDAIYCFTRDGRGPCYAIEGQKKYVSWVGPYVIAVVKKQKSILSSQPGTTLIVVDTENKMIVFSQHIEDLFCIINRNNKFYVITREEEPTSKSYAYNMYILDEHDISFKVRLLTKNAMYDTTLRLLEREGYACSEDAAIVRYQFGNHLLSKGDPSRAAKEYIRTIGFVKPFNIISKLLTPRYNEYLIEYLEEFVKSDDSTDEHRRLLQSCLDRRDLSSGIEQLSTLQDGTHNTDNIQLGDFKYPSNRAANFLLFANVWQNLRKDKNLAELYKEQEILNFFLESGQELLEKHSETVLATIKALVHDKKTDNILDFLSILSQDIEFCLNILSEIIQINPDCDEKLYYYMLILYLELWREKKASSEDILNFLKNKRLRHDKILIICGLYFFTNGIKHIQSNPTDAEHNNNGETILKECMKSLIKNFPEHSFLFETSSRSFLMLLKSACSNTAMNALHLKQFFKDKSLNTFMDTHNELASINDLKDQIKQSTSLISRYKCNPIEFRNTSCDICRQPLQMPSVYFLCQHSFHKECVNYNSKLVSNATCSVCSKNVNYYVDKEENNPFEEDEENSGDIIAGISKSLATGIIPLTSGNNIFTTESLTSGNSKSKAWAVKISEKRVAASSNPFDSNYNSFD